MTVIKKFSVVKLWGEKGEKKEKIDQKKLGMGISPVSNVCRAKEQQNSKMQEAQLLVSNICRSKEQQNWQDPGSLIGGV